MIKTILAVIALIALAFVACSDDDASNGGPGNGHVTRGFENCFQSACRAIEKQFFAGRGF